MPELTREEIIKALEHTENDKRLVNSILTHLVSIGSQDMANDSKISLDDVEYYKEFGFRNDGILCEHSGFAGIYERNWLFIADNNQYAYILFDEGNCFGHYVPATEILGKLDKVDIVIYQLPLGDKRRFWGTHTEWYKPFDRNAFAEVYRCKRPEDYNQDDAFREFNQYHPIDYTASSVSVGDIVSINNIEYFCDSVGWKPVSSLKIPKVDSENC